MAKNELISLSILNIASMHTYAINEIVKQVGLEEWAKISSASLYNTINKLEKDECVSCELVQVGNMPQRKVFSITEKGKERLREEMCSAIKHVSPYDEEFYLSLTFGQGLETEEFIELLVDRKNTLISMYAGDGCNTEIETHNMMGLIHANILMECGRNHFYADEKLINDLVELLNGNPNYYNELKEKFKNKLSSEQGE